MATNSIYDYEHGSMMMNKTYFKTLRELLEYIVCIKVPEAALVKYTTNFNFVNNLHEI